MEDLIKRSDAIKALRKLGHEVVVVDKVCSLGVAAEFIDVIRTVPSADLNSEFSEWARHWFKDSADRPQGVWEIYTVSPFDGEDCRCSECGQTGCAPYWDYCPNCGARMKGADNDQ